MVHVVQRPHVQLIAKQPRLPSQGNLPTSCINLTHINPISVCGHDGCRVFIMMTSTLRVTIHRSNFVHHNDVWCLEVSFLTDWISSSTLAKHTETKGASRKPPKDEEHSNFSHHFPCFPTLPPRHPIFLHTVGALRNLWRGMPHSVAQPDFWNQ